MRVIVKGKNIEITDALRSHAESKVAKVEKLGLNYQEVEIKLGVEKNPSIRDNQIAEITLSGNGPLLRSTDHDRDMYVAIDKAITKLQRRLKKYHGKLIDRSRSQEAPPKTQVPEVEEEEAEESPKIVKSKTIDPKPMAPEEATLQMDMLGYDFFVFRDSESEDIVVVYRRKDGNYGMIDVSG
ncbi:MAG: ribosome-associated translation inhibitor RaiA [Actinobacteria bacterium]|nr:ribosome-associated translation inhibitor RaiA [Actinomycetota bacterium]